MPHDTMRAIAYHDHGDPSQLALVEAPMPVPQEGEVRVRVKAAALNGFDPMMLAGATGLKTPLPMIPCGDCAGIVDVVGPGVSGVAKDARVSVYPILPVKGMMGETTPGAACEFICVPVSALVAMPVGVSFEDAAALPVAYGTALRMVETRGRVRVGDKVLILGAAGGVGVAALQLCKALGAYVIAGASSAEKCARLKALGADETVDTSQDWRKALIARHGKPAFYGEPSGVDVIINYVGGDTWVDSLKVLKNEGRILVCGASAGHDPKEDLRYIWSFEQSIIGCNGWSPVDQAELLLRVADGRLKPVIDSARPLEQLPAAMADLIARRTVGKAVILL
jgi:alcohol dehydrogenase